MGSFTSALWVRKYLVDHEHWERLATGRDGARYEKARGELRVILSGARELDGKRWLHLSLSHSSRIPRHDEMRDAKFVFLGDLKAIQVFPARGEYVNIHPRCLHLFACIGRDSLPDFTRGSNSL